MEKVFWNAVPAYVLRRNSRNGVPALSVTKMALGLRNNKLKEQPVVRVS
jgi:hypothetical protein